MGLSTKIENVEINNDTSATTTINKTMVQLAHEAMNKAKTTGYPVKRGKRTSFHAALSSTPLIFDVVEVL